MIKNKYFWLILLIALYILYFVVQSRREILYKEGFTQSRPFVLKTNEDAYDKFYAEIYDVINIPEKSSKFDYETVINSTMPDKDNTNFLIIGSGTGDLVSKLTDNGFNAHGIDKSEYMVAESKSKYPTIDVKCDCVELTNAFDKNAFSHITCTDFTLYYMKNKYDFFKKCYNWLIPNGYLILHIVDKDKFTPSKPCVNKVLDMSVSDISALKNVNKTNIDFGDFNYSVVYNKMNDRMITKETFTDKSSKKIRQNEIVLHIENADEIMKIARNAGFIQHSQFNLPDDKHQYAVIFERIG